MHRRFVRNSNVRLAKASQQLEDLELFHRSQAGDTEASAKSLAGFYQVFKQTGF
jgi:hypothetical protein